MSCYFYALTCIAIALATADSAASLERRQTKGSTLKVPGYGTLPMVEWKDYNNYTTSIDDIEYLGCSQSRTKKLKAVFESNKRISAELAKVLLNFDRSNPLHWTTFTMLDSIFRFGLSSEDSGINKTFNREFVGNVYREVSEGAAINGLTGPIGKSKSHMRVVCSKSITEWLLGYPAYARSPWALMVISPSSWNPVEKSPCGGLHSGVFDVWSLELIVLHENVHLVSSGLVGIPEVYQVESLVKISEGQAMMNAQNYAMAGIAHKYSCEQDVRHTFGSKPQRD